MPIDFRAELSAPQHAAATHMDGPMLVLAGAGSGKTRTLVYRLAYLVEHGVPAKDILLLTFTNKAANEMRHRAVELLDERCNDVTACTYHSFGAQMLHEYADLAGLPEGYSILMQHDVETVMDIIRPRCIVNPPAGYPNSNRLGAIMSSAANRSTPIRETILVDDNFNQFRRFIDDPGFVESLERFQSEYHAYKERHAMLDYDDLMTAFRNLLVRHPEVRRKIGERYSHIMVDEFQDSNALQVSIVSLLRQQSDNLMVVGDDYQSIYAFRAADVNNILRFPAMMGDLGTPNSGMSLDDKYDIVSPGTRIDDMDGIVYLDRNYRSTKQIVAFANAVMDANAQFGFKKDMTASRDGSLPVLMMLRSEHDEARHIVDMIRQDHAKYGTPYKEMAILSRTAREQREVIRLLAQEGIPVRRFGGKSLFDMEGIILLTSHLRVIANPQDELAWRRILAAIPTVAGHEDYMMPLILGRPDMGFLDGNNWGQSKALPDLLRLRSDLQRMRTARFLEALDIAIGRCQDLLRVNATINEQQPDMPFDSSTALAQRIQVVMEEARESFAQFRQVAERFDNAKALLDAIALGEIPDNLGTPAEDGETAESEDEDSVVVSTIHSAKGLEFAVVFLMNCVDRLCPKVKAEEIGNDSDMEELRCFYVATTRARERLYMFAPATARVGYNVLPVRRSHYLEGIDGSLLDVIIK